MIPMNDDESHDTIVLVLVVLVPVMPAVLRLILKLRSSQFLARSWI
jgi:hypothetical protein